MTTLAPPDPATRQAPPRRDVVHIRPSTRTSAVRYHAAGVGYPIRGYARRLPDGNIRDLFYVYRFARRNGLDEMSARHVIHMTLSASLSLTDWFA